MTAAPDTGLYFHWPFCARICPYCDFTVLKARDVDEGAWTTSMVRDLADTAERLGARRLHSVYFGGGTPSLIGPTGIERLMGSVADLFELSGDTEVTLEANPGQITQGRLAEWRSAGINRLSLGVQSFDDNQLAFLGRDHDGDTARRALDDIAQCFDQYTYDLIYGLPDETSTSWLHRLEGALARHPAPHLSLYQLTVEEGTAFGAAASRGDWSPIEEGHAADLYRITEETTEAAGYENYEVSSYARPGQRAVHNGLYWRGADWIGVGPGAHGRLTIDGKRWATAPAKLPKEWLTAMPRDRYDWEVLDEEQVLTERLAGSLRLAEGVSWDALPDGASARLASVLRDLQEGGFVHNDPGRIILTKEGRLLTDYIIGRLCSAL